MTTSPISIFHLPPCPAQREKGQSQGCSSRCLGLYHTEDFSLISLKIPGLLLFWPGRCLEGLEKQSLLASQHHTSAKGLGQLLLLLKALPEVSSGLMVFVRRSQGAGFAGDARSHPFFSRNQITKLSPHTREGGLSPEGLDLGFPPSPQRQWRSQGWGSAIIHIPHAVELKSQFFCLHLPLEDWEPSTFLIAPSVRGGGEAMWEGTGGVGEAVGRWVQTPQGHGTPGAEAWRARKPILTPCGQANGGRLEQAFDLSLPCRSRRRSRLVLGRDEALQAGLAPRCHLVARTSPWEGGGKQESCNAQVERGEGSGC